MDIGSGSGFPSATLSNFAPHPFVFDGVECNSMEGLLQSFKFANPEMQKEVCKLVGKQAKFKGKKKKWWRTQTLYWQGKEFKRDSEEYQGSARVRGRPCTDACDPLQERERARHHADRGTQERRHRRILCRRYGVRQLQLQVPAECLHHQERRRAGTFAGSVPCRNGACRQEGGLPRTRRRLCRYHPGVYPHGINRRI